MFPTHSNPAPQRLIDRAHKLGIIVITVADALRFLQKQKTRPIGGLAALGTGTKLYGGRHIDDIAAERRFHADRVARRANRIAANIMRQPSPLRYIIKQPYTADLNEAIWDRVYQLISQHLEEKLCETWPYQVPAIYWNRSRWLDVWIVNNPSVGLEAPCIPRQKLGSYTRNAIVSLTKLAVIHLWPNPVVNGVLIIHIVPLVAGESEAIWVQQGRGNAFTLVHGFIIGEMRIEADDLENARKIAAAKKETLASDL